jgi:hypothetical protein
MDKDGPLAEEAGLGVNICNHSEQTRDIITIFHLRPMKDRTFAFYIPKPPLPSPLDTSNPSTPCVTSSPSLNLPALPLKIHALCCQNSFLIISKCSTAIPAFAFFFFSCSLAVFDSFGGKEATSSVSLATRSRIWFEPCSVGWSS